MPGVEKQAGETTQETSSWKLLGDTRNPEPISQLSSDIKTIQPGRQRVMARCQVVGALLLFCTICPCQCYSSKLEIKSQ